MNGRVVLEVPAKPDFLLLARLAATGVGRSAGASEETIADLKLAVTEAVANAVRHAYPEDDPGRVWVELSADGGKVEISVSDEGRRLGGADLKPAEQPGESGMGLSIIRAIADEVDVGAGRDGRGTRVRFACRL